MPCPWAAKGAFSRIQSQHTVDVPGQFLGFRSARHLPGRVADADVVPFRLARGRDTALASARLAQTPHSWRDEADSPAGGVAHGEAAAFRRPAFDRLADDAFARLHDAAEDMTDYNPAGGVRNAQYATVS